MIAIALSVVMTLSGMTAYASENQDEDLQPQTIEAIEKTEETDTDLESVFAEEESETMNADETGLMEDETSSDSEKSLPTQDITETDLETESDAYSGTDGFEKLSDKGEISDNPESEARFETQESLAEEAGSETQESFAEEEPLESTESLNAEETSESEESFTMEEKLEMQESTAGEESLNAEETFESEESLVGEELLESEESSTEEEPLESVENFNAEDSLESVEGLEAGESPTEEEGLVIEFADTSSYEYTGTAIRPEIRVRNNGKDLTEGSDYSVRYTNNINVSTGAAANKQPRVTVTGKGAFSGSASATFRIARKDINAEDVIKSKIIVVRGKKAPMPAIYYGSTKLAAKDFSYNKATVFNTVGSTTLAVTGAGNFSGNTVIDVTVVENAAAQKELAKKFSVTIDKAKASQLIYTGESLEEAVRSCIQVNAKDAAKTNLTANAAQNYRIVFPKNVTDVGTVKFTVVGIGDYSGCNVTKTCKILPKTIQSSDILLNENAAQGAVAGKVVISGTGSTAAYTSVGAVFSNLQLQYGNNDLKEGRDYRVSYSGNRRAADGKASFTISFMGNYKGKYTSPKFTVAKAELSERTVDSVVLPDQVCNGADGVYKSNAYVSIGGVTLNRSEYETRYYTDAQRTQEMSRDNPLRLSNGTATVYVKIIPTAKGNYTLSNEQDAAKGSYTVWTKGDQTKDLSRAKVAFYDASDKKITKMDYTGRPVRPAKIVVTVGGTDFASDAANAPYTVEIVNNINKGKASVIINAKADSGYTGAKTAAFSIVSHSIKNLLFRQKPKDPTGEGKILIAYFSWSNNTERMAEYIQNQTGGDLYEIVPVTPYPTEYTPTTEVAREERDKNARPAIKDLPESIAEYDRILIGYPIWWHTAPMIIGTFLEAYDLSGVDIYPFTQSASMDAGQFNQSMQFVRQCAPGAAVHDGLFARATDTAAITAYLTENGLLKGTEEKPEEPTEPEQPTEPEEPTEPEQPTEPEEPTEPEQPTEQGKTLIAYFSWSNNTRTMAEYIQNQTGGDLYEIVPVTPYPMEYTPTTEVAKEEVDNNARPAIKDLPESIAEYDRILIGYPIWWHTAPMIIGTFLEAYDLSGVDIYPFTQSASMDAGQFNQSMQFVRQCAPGAAVHDGLFTRATNTEAITAYLTQNGLIKEAAQ